MWNPQNRANGTVFKAVNRLNGTLAAIKQMKIDPKVLPEIKREVLTINELSGPFCVEYHASYFKDDQLWLAMELFDSGSIGDVLEKQKRLSEPEIVSVVYQTLNALNFLHKQHKVHRDIKAGNLMLNRRGIVKLGDFGLCSTLEGSSKLTTQVGSPFWMAPEIIVGESYDYRADIWSLGITILEMSNHEHELFDRNPMSAMFQIVSEDPPTFERAGDWTAEIHALLTTCLTKDPAKRLDAEHMLKLPLFQREDLAKTATMTLAPLAENHSLLRVQELEQKMQQPPGEEECAVVQFRMPDGSHRRMLVYASQTVKEVILRIAQKINLEIGRIEDFSLSYLRGENVHTIKDTSQRVLAIAKTFRPNSQFFNFLQAPDTESFVLLTNSLVHLGPALPQTEPPDSPGLRPRSSSVVVRSSSGTIRATMASRPSLHTASMLISAHEGAIRTFLRAMLAPNLPILTGLVQAVPHSKGELLALCLVETFEGLQQAPRVFRRACECEVLGLDHVRINDLFRGTSLTGRMMSAYVRLVGTEYAQYILKPLLQPLLHLPNALELDMARMQKSGDLRADLFQLRTNMTALQRVAKEIFQSLFLSIDRMPASFRSICRELQLTITHHFGEKQNLIVPTSFLFSRYLCPVIVSPQSYGVFSEPPPPQVSRTLVLLSKLVQSLASGVHFGSKESYMTDMNPYLDEHRTMVSRYFERVMSSISSAPAARKTVVVKSIGLEKEDEAENFLKVVDNVNLQTISWAPALYGLVELTNEYLLEVGTKLKILPPAPSELP